MRLSFFLSFTVWKHPTTVSSPRLFVMRLSSRGVIIVVRVDTSNEPFYIGSSQPATFNIFEREGRVRGTKK